MISVTEEGAESPTAVYAYDGLNRRITSDDGTAVRHTYYSSQWQWLEERLNSSTSAERQALWGLRYIDDLVLRDRSPTNNGTLSERLYATQDANWNTTAVVDTAGDPQERYRYTAYGTPTFLNADFSPKSPNESSFDWENLYAGYRYDVLIQCYDVRYRVLEPLLGRWVTPDQKSYSDSLNDYLYCQSNPLRHTDTFGRETGEYVHSYTTHKECEQRAREFDETQDSTLLTQLYECCKCKGARHLRGYVGNYLDSLKCKKEARSILAGLREARASIYSRGGPAYLSYWGVVCTDCAATVLHKLGYRAVEYFEYSGVDYQVINPLGLGSHAWGEVKCKATGQYTTIDFWQGGKDYWAPGRNSMGWTAGKEQCNPFANGPHAW